MRKKVNTLLFDFTKDNLEAHEIYKENMISGSNVLEDIIQYKNGEFSDSFFVKLIEVECDDNDNYIKDEKMGNILGIDEKNLCFYQIYTCTFNQHSSFTRGYLNDGKIGEFKILSNKVMFERNPIFELRFKIREKWSAWHAIAGKFIVAQNYNMGPGGIAGLYSSITKEEIETFKQSFQIRYSGSLIPEILKSNTLHRIINDPFDSSIRKIIDPATSHILFDSQVIHEVSSDKSFEIWRKFEERYR
jgi:hypothetical protein